MALLSPGFRSNFLGHPVEDMLENCERLETERHVISAAFLQCGLERCAICRQSPGVRLNTKEKKKKKKRRGKLLC